MNINWRRVIGITALSLAVIAVGWYFLGRGKTPVSEPIETHDATPTAPAVAELERATAIIEAADAHKKALGCNDCSTRVEAAVRDAELQRLRKENEEIKAKPPAPTPTQRVVVDINVHQPVLPPLPPPARNPCEPADPCYRRQPN